MRMTASWPAPDCTHCLHRALSCSQSHHQLGALFPRTNHHSCWSWENYHTLNSLWWNLRSLCSFDQDHWCPERWGRQAFVRKSSMWQSKYKQLLTQIRGLGICKLSLTVCMYIPGVLVYYFTLIVSMSSCHWPYMFTTYLFICFVCVMYDWLVTCYFCL